MRPRTFKDVVRRTALLVPRPLLMTVIASVFLMGVLPLSLIVGTPKNDLGDPNEALGLGVLVGGLVLLVFVFVKWWGLYTKESIAWRNDAVELEKWSLIHGGSLFEHGATGEGQRGLVPYTLPGEHDLAWAITLEYKGLRSRVEAYRVAPNGFVKNGEGRIIPVGADDYTICTVLTDYNFPRTVARPHRVPRFLARAMQLPDIEMESEDFNQRWRLVGDDARITHGLMNPLAIDRFLDPQMKHTIVTFDGRAIRTVRRDFHLDVESTEAHLDALVALAATASVVTERF